MDTGFNYYHGADPSEYDLVLSNSEGGLDAPARARRPPGRDRPLGGRPRVLPPARRSRRSTTSSSTATATSSGASGWPRSSASRAGATGGSTSRSAAATSRGDIGGARLDRRRPVQRLRARDLGGARSTSTSRGARTRRVDGSSTCRPFELAAARRRDRLEPARGDRALVRARASELLVVDDADEALDGVPRRCSTTRLRPRRWARARASGCSTSTRYAPPRAAGAAICSGSSTAVPCMTPARRSRSSRRSTRRRRSARVVDGDPRVRPGASTSSSSTTARRDGTADAAAARGRASSSACRSTSASAAPCRPGFQLRARARTTTLAVRLDGDGQHDPSELPKLLAPLERGEADVVTGSRFADEAGGYRPPLGAAASGSRWFAKLVSLLSRQRVTDTTSGFQALNRSGDRAVRRATTRSDYPEVEATVLVLKHRLRLRRGAGRRCASASTGSSSITFLPLDLLHGQGDARAVRRHRSAARPSRPKVSSR